MLIVVICCMQAALAWWSTVSPFSPYGPTIALVFVLLVAALKAIIEDKKRHQEDRITNNSIAHVVQQDGETPPILALKADQRISEDWRVSYSHAVEQLRVVAVLLGVVCT